MADPRSDSELLSVLRTGDRRAFEALFHRYHARLCSYALQLTGHDGVAEEIVQDLFLFVWNKRDSLELRDDALAHYMFASVRNAAISQHRRRKLEELKADSVIELMAHPERADRLAESEELARAVREAVAKLPDRCRDVITLHREQGLSYKEVGATLGIAPNTVEVHMAKAFRLLRRHLASHWKGA